MIHYLAYPGDARVFISSTSSNDPDLTVKAANGRTLRPLDVTPRPIAVAVHGALADWSRFAQMLRGVGAIRAAR